MTPVDPAAVDDRQNLGMSVAGPALLPTEFEGPWVKALAQIDPRRMGICFNRRCAAAELVDIGGEFGDGLGQFSLRGLGELRILVVQECQGAKSTSDGGSDRDIESLVRLSPTYGLSPGMGDSDSSGRGCRALPPNACGSCNSRGPPGAAKHGCRAGAASPAEPRGRHAILIPGPRAW